MSKPQKDRQLKDAKVVVNRVYQKNTIHNVILSWRVPDFEKLSCNVMYFRLYESDGIKCVLRLFKREESLYLSLSSANIPKDTEPEFLILDEKNLASLTNKAETISDGIFISEFSNESFLKPDSNFLKDGILTVAFKYLSECYSTFKETQLEETEILADFDELCSDLKNMYLNALYSDFRIHVRDYTFECHRFILAARSKHFEKLLENADLTEHALSDDILPGIVHELLLYVYSGELKAMNVDSMLDLYKLAIDLDVCGLGSRCLEYFKKELKEDNWKRLWKFANDFDLKELKNAIIHTAEEKNIKINIFDAFKPIAKVEEYDADVAKVVVKDADIAGGD